jgi:hypothetical protein
MSNLTIGLNVDGVLTSPNLHDGSLVGIVLAPNSDLSLYCRAVDAKIYKMIVPAIEQMRADNFLQGNIIFDICVYEQQSCPRNAVEDLYCYSNEAREHRYARHESIGSAFISSLLEKIERENWTLVMLGSSYGCELIALSRQPAEAISIREISNIPA